LISSVNDKSSPSVSNPRNLTVRKGKGKKNTSDNSLQKV